MNNNITKNAKQELIDRITEIDEFSKENILNIINEITNEILYQVPMCEIVDIVKSLWDRFGEIHELEANKENELEMIIQDVADILN